MKKKCDISFIVVNYNGAEHTRVLLSSFVLYLCDYDYEVIVVDNGSTYNEAAELEREFPQYIYIRSEFNLGFSGGNNLAIRNASREFIMLINNDAYLIDSSVIKLSAFLKERADVGAVSPKILFENPVGYIQYAGFTEFSPVFLRNKAIGYMSPDIGQYNISSRVWSTHGAAMMVKKEVLNFSGLMPEIYFLYYEEFDWCNKIKEAGYEIWYNPDCVVVHKEGSTTKGISSLKNYYLTRNRLLYAFRNLRGVSKGLSIIYQLFIVLPKEVIKLMIIGNFNKAFAVLKGAWSFIRLKDKNVKVFL